MTMSTANASPTSRPVVRRISADDVYAALRQGYGDFRAAPRFGLFFGGAYAAAGILLFLLLWLVQQPLWIVPFAFAFPLIGPFAAIGLYEVSRRRETGEPLSWSAILGVVWAQRNRQLPSMAFVVVAFFFLWMWAASMLVILVLGRMGGAVYSNLDAILAMQAALGDRAAIGAGTVLTPEEVRAVAATGASFIVSPNADPRVIARTKELGLGSYPGVFTATECFAALAAGCTGFGLGSALYKAGWPASRVADAARTAVTAWDEAHGRAEV